MDFKELMVVLMVAAGVSGNLFLLTLSIALAKREESVHSIVS